MADYYPLIARAVAGLEKNNGDARRALYERARTALLAQLRGVSPALSDSDVTRERLGLEEAIRKVEAESARQSRSPEPPRSEPSRKVRAPEMPRWDAFTKASGSSASGAGSAASSSSGLFDGGSRRSNPPPRPDGGMARRQPPAPVGRGATAVNLFDESRYADPVFDQSMADLVPPPQSSPSAPPRPTALRGRAAGERRSLLDTGLKDFRNVAADNDLDDAPVRPSKQGREAIPDDFPPARNLDRNTDFDRFPAPARDDAGYDLPPPPLLEPAFGGDDVDPVPQRVRAGPMPTVDDEDLAPPRPRRSIGDIVRVIAVIAFVGLIGGLLFWQWPMVTALYSALRTPSETARENGTAPTTRNNKIVDRFESGQPSQVPASPSTAPGAAAVAQRVVLYEEDPGDPNGKRFVGSAIWRTESVSPGPGLPPEMAIRADVEIPERHISMTWSLRRNADPGLPASHTVEIMFKLPEDFPSGTISNVPGILMKQAEQTRGVPLAGLAVKVTNGFFLIGLSAVDADRERNIQLLKERAWFDIPVVYSNNRRAILALEKGTPGERAFAEAFRAWRQ
jgi:hypothetical protein